MASLYNAKFINIILQLTNNIITDKINIAITLKLTF